MVRVRVRVRAWLGLEVGLVHLWVVIPVAHANPAPVAAALGPMLGLGLR